MELSAKDAARFWGNVEKLATEAGCWIWLPCYSRYIYGTFSLKGEAHYAHRLSMQMDGRETTKDKPFVLHSCHLRCCVNPEHLRAGSPAENGDDRRKKTLLKRRILHA